MGDDAVLRAGTCGLRRRRRRRPGAYRVSRTWPSHGIISVSTSYTWHGHDSFMNGFTAARGVADGSVPCFLVVHITDSTLKSYS